MNLSKYDRLASRFVEEKLDAVSLLKSGMDTRNERFNRLIERIEQVAIHSREPLLLTGPTGAGKSRLARRIFELRKSRHRLEGDFVEVNCATIRGEGAMSALFGHLRGSFTGAMRVVRVSCVRHTAACCSSTRSASWRSTNRPCCSAPSRRKRSSRWAAIAR